MAGARGADDSYMGPFPRLNGASVRRLARTRRRCCRLSRPSHSTPTQTCAAGLAARHDNEPAERLMARVDSELYADKHVGRNQLAASTAT
jgi:PleD family two-component response regulator